MRNLVRQEEDALDALEKACRRNFSIQYIHRMAKMLILQNVEAQEAVNRKLRDMGLGDVSLADDSQDPGVLSSAGTTRPVSWTLLRETRKGRIS